MHKGGTSLSSVRILVADDYADWRRQIRLLLQARPEWKVICEVADGSEAVQKAEELKPDLILLDMGLPKLSGIEVARRIRHLSPGSKIIFISLNNSLDIVQAALSTGALGYVDKVHVRSELLPAIDSVLAGRQFVSSGLKDHGLTEGSDAQAPHCHEVQFYSDDEVFLESFTQFIAAALRAGKPTIVIVTKSHRDVLLQKLKAQSLNVDAAIECGRFIVLDVTETLSTFMVDDMPDPARFSEVAAGLIETAAKAASTERSRIAACGECAPLLWAEGKADAAIEVERLWDKVAKTYRVDILCGYAMASFESEEHDHIFQSISAEHTAVYSR